MVPHEFPHATRHDDSVMVDKASWAIVIAPARFHKPIAIHDVFFEVFVVDFPHLSHLLIVVISFKTLTLISTGCLSFGGGPYSSVIASIVLSKTADRAETSFVPRSALRAGGHFLYSILHSLIFLPYSPTNTAPPVLPTGFQIMPFAPSFLWDASGTVIFKTPSA